MASRAQFGAARKRINAKNRARDSRVAAGALRAVSDSDRTEIGKQTAAALAAKAAPRSISARLRLPLAAQAAESLPRDRRGRILAAAAYLESTYAPQTRREVWEYRTTYGQGPREAHVQGAREAILDGSGFDSPSVRAYAFLVAREALERDCATERLLSTGDVCQAYGLRPDNRTTLKRARDRGDFPAPHRETSSGPVWRASDLPDHLGTHDLNLMRLEATDDGIPF